MNSDSKGTILFLITSARSHLGITFKAAKTLQEAGFKIVYASDSRFKGLIEQQGFDYYNLTINLFLWFKPELMKAGNSIFKLFLSNILAGKNNRYFKMKLQAMHFKKEINKINPQVIFLDSYYIFTYIFLHNLSAKITVLNTQLSSEYSHKTPPINTGFMPTKSKIFDSLIINLLWSRFFLFRFFKERLTERLLFWGNDNFSLLRKFSKQEGFPLSKRLNKNKFYYGFHDLEEISFVPQLFDFYGSPLPSMTHAISMVGSQPVDERDASYLSAKDRMIKIKLERNWPIIYCCFGTLSAMHSARCSQFYETLVQVLDKRDMILVISTGKSESFNHLVSVAQNKENVFVFEHLPQLDMLGHSDVMINHGGISSVLECICKEVPMIVYPLSSFLDQKGNAARVVYHSLGIRGSISRENKNSLEEKIDKILAGNYKDHIRVFNSKLSYEVNVENILYHSKVI